MKHYLLILAVALLGNICAFAQTMITGTVVDKNNAPLIGVQVMPEAGGDAVTTDFDGRFEIAVPEGTKLRFSMLGAKDQTEAAAEGMVVVMGGKKAAVSNSGEWNWREKKWENFLTVTYGLNPLELAESLNNFASAQTFGLRYGQCRYVGWFVEANMGTGFHFNTPQVEYIEKDGKPYLFDPTQNVYGIPVYTGRQSIQHVAGIAGIMVRLGIPLYANFGVGYAYHNKTLETNSGLWIPQNASPHHLVFEELLSANVKNVNFLLGVDLIIPVSQGQKNNLLGMNAKIGIGYTFPANRLNERVAARQARKKGGNK